MNRVWRLAGLHAGGGSYPHAIMQDPAERLDKLEELQSFADRRADELSEQLAAMERRVREFDARLSRLEQSLGQLSERVDRRSGPPEGAEGAAPEELP